MDAHHAMHKGDDEFKAMENGVCTAGWEPIGTGLPPPPFSPDNSTQFETCARAARVLKLRPDGGPCVSPPMHARLPSVCFYHT